jgi:hypothetical protein
MKNEEMIILGLAGLAVWFILKGKAATAWKAPAYVTSNGNSNGWQFFSDGTSIGDDGTYYSAAGNAVWSPTGRV